METTKDPWLKAQVFVGPLLGFNVCLGHQGATHPRAPEDHGPATCRLCSARRGLQGQPGQLGLVLVILKVTVITIEILISITSNSDSNSNNRNITGNSDSNSNNNRNITRSSDSTIDSCTRQVHRMNAQAGGLSDSQLGFST